MMTKIKMRLSYTMQATSMFQRRQDQPVRNTLSMNSTAVSRIFQSTAHKDLLRTAVNESRKLQTPSSPLQPWADFRQCSVTTNAFENN